MNVIASKRYAALYASTQEQDPSAKNAAKTTNAGSASRASNQSVVATAQAKSQSAIVSLSSRALGALLNSTESMSAQSYFSVRNGYAATTLAKAVANPGITSSSTGKNIGDAAKDARNRLNATYAELEKSGQPFDLKAHGKSDAYTLMSDLDRRSLFAVSSNTEGLFSADEQAIAKSIMNRQRMLASGIHPDASQSQVNLATNANSLRAGLSFLNKVSSEEKASPDWKAQVQQLAKLSAIANKASSYASNQGLSLMNYL